MRARGLKPQQAKEDEPPQRSRPMRARGLKLVAVLMAVPVAGSRPMRARGLKHTEYGNQVAVFEVAPHAGAWIETQ